MFPSKDKKNGISDANDTHLHDISIFISCFSLKKENSGSVMFKYFSYLIQNIA